jgi:hypothetical protein
MTPGPSFPAGLTKGVGAPANGGAGSARTFGHSLPPVDMRPNTAPAQQSWPYRRAHSRTRGVGVMDVRFEKVAVGISYSEAVQPSYNEVG